MQSCYVAGIVDCGFAEALEKNKGKHQNPEDHGEIVKTREPGYRRLDIG